MALHRWCTSVVVLFVVLMMTSCGERDDDPTPTSPAGSTSTPISTDKDSDGDGLLDEWETNGIDVDGDRAIDLALHEPPYNADPLHKDIFVEIDYMPGQQLTDGARQILIERFAEAPVPNPDGDPGITLHLMVDEQLPTIDPIRFYVDPDDRNGIERDFDDLKLGGQDSCDGHFATLALRSDPECASKIDAWRLVFRYGVLAERLMRSSGEPSTSTGIAELPGNDFVVTLGALAHNDAGYYVFDVDPDPQEETLVEIFPVDVAQAATIMHELGHTLGLRHGGGDDWNCKPNYLSVMSYVFQFPFLPNYTNDYSGIELPSLDESDLDERVSVGGGADSSTIFGLRRLSKSGPAGGEIDWDGDGSFGATRANVNDIESVGCSTGGEAPDDQTLTGHNDWQNLDYNFRDAMDFADGLHNSAQDLEEITINQIVAFASELDFDNDGLPHLFDNCPFTSSSSPNNANCPVEAVTPGPTPPTPQPDPSATPPSSPTVEVATPTVAVPPDDTPTQVTAPTVTLPPDDTPTPDDGDDCLNGPDLDNDGIIDACDSDDDNDGHDDTGDNCAQTSNPSQFDNDEDTAGDACDPDDDNDTVHDGTDNCPFAANPVQGDFDQDGQGDACDDSDADGVNDDVDNCRLVANSDQIDSDRDLIGDACEVEVAFSCVTFDAQREINEFSVNDFLTEADTVMQFEDFSWSNGELYEGGSARIADGILWFNNINLRFIFDAPVSEVRIKYNAQGGNNNLVINGELVNFGSFSTVPANVEGVKVNIEALQNVEQGALVLTGLIQSLSLGGQELSIDNVCYR